MCRVVREIMGVIKSCLLEWMIDWKEGLGLHKVLLIDFMGKWLCL